MENRAEALMEISRHLADEGELPPRDEAEAGDELASKRRVGEA